MFRDNTASSKHASQTTFRPPDYLVNIANETKQSEIGIFAFFKAYLREYCGFSITDY